MTTSLLKDWQSCTTVKTTDLIPYPILTPVIISLAFSVAIIYSHFVIPSTRQRQFFCCFILTFCSEFVFLH